MLTKKHMRILWLRMGELYDVKWTNSHGEKDQNDTWLKGLKDLTPEMIGDGLTGCLNQYKAWPPTLMQFRDLCLGIPDKALLKHQVVNGAQSNDPMVKKMRALIGSWNLSHCTYAELDRMVESAYKELCGEINTIKTGQLEHSEMQRLEHD